MLLSDLAKPDTTTVHLPKVFILFAVYMDQFHLCFLVFIACEENMVRGGYKYSESAPPAQLLRAGAAPSPRS
jgi:hypothetical protein